MKTKHNPKKRQQDWHPALVIAELKIAGTSLSALSVASGYHRTTLRNALYRHYPKAELIIAEKLGLRPQDIWGSRYPNS